MHLPMNDYYGLSEIQWATQRSTLIQCGMVLERRKRDTWETLHSA